jgi:NDP-sugar pyrophosphorylase family protein
VHPTAIVERSILGANVRIEAHASVIDSVIGDDVHIADHSVIHTSAIGDRCRTLVDTHLRRVVAMPGSTLSNLDMQDAVFGAGVFLTTGVAFFPDGPGRNVVVDGRDSGRAVGNGAVGKGAILGSRALFRCGVAVPAGALVVARPEEAVGKFDAGSLGRAAMILGDRGTHS